MNLISRFNKMIDRTENNEFTLIRDLLSNIGTERKDVLIDVGDDCALTHVPSGQELAFSIDTLVSGVHFFPDCEPESLGHKALAVGLSDLAAVGAEPAWATLALTLPNADRYWIKQFAKGIHRLASEYSLRLVGGDLTRGPLSITMQVMGFVKTGSTIRRSGGQPGDILMVSGYLGNAGLALRHLISSKTEQNKTEIDHQLRIALERPTPRVKLGLGLRKIANAAIDISDGLIGDLGHLTHQSQCGAELQLEQIPMSNSVSEKVRSDNDWSLPLCSGDDYELCFSVPQRKIEKVYKLASQLKCQVTVIGHLSKEPGIRLMTKNGDDLTNDIKKFKKQQYRSYNHFL